MPENLVRRLIIIAMMGVVGSGKTYVAKILAKRLKLLHIRADELRVKQREKGRKRVETRIFALVKKPLEKALKRNRSVILDADFRYQDRQKELKAIAKRWKARLYFIYVSAPERLILKRLGTHHYTKNDLFQGAEEAIKIYYTRRKWHNKIPRIKRMIFIDNSKPLGRQLLKLIKIISG